MSTTLEEIKVEVLHDFEQRDKCEYLSLYDVADRYEIEDVVDEVAERYAQYKTQELQEKNAELAKELAYVVKALKTVSSF